MSAPKSRALAKYAIFTHSLYVTPVQLVHDNHVKYFIKASSLDLIDSKSRIIVRIYYPGYKICITMLGIGTRWCCGRKIQYNVIKYK